METSKQLSIHLENKPGRLANILSALAREKVNIVAMTVMDSHDSPVLRLSNRIRREKAAKRERR